MKGILGDAAREHCCAYQCEYSLDRVRWHLDRLLAYQRAGEVPDLAYASPQLGRFGGAPGDGPTALLDVGRVVSQLRAEGMAVTAELVASRLCPFSTEGATSP